MTSGVPNIPTKAWEVRLAKNVEEELTLDHFDVVEVDVPEPGDGEVLVRVDYVPLAAAFKDLMKTDCQLPIPPWKPGDVVGAGGVGTVVKSNSPDLAVGDPVQAFLGWSEYWSGPAQQFHKIDLTYVPSPTYYLNQGPTAYYGMATLAKAGEGDVVFVTGAAGGVGSLAGQIAKARGAKLVIGSAGSKAKCDYLVNELGFDAAFDYHDGPVLDRLRELAPEGINVFFDTVGGEQFEAAVQAAAPHARFALAGALASQASNSKVDHPRFDLMTAITKHLEIRPFACYHTPEQIQDWVVHFAQWSQEGKFVFPSTVVEGGIKEAPQGLINLLAGKYTGNVTVKVSSD